MFFFTLLSQQFLLHFVNQKLYYLMWTKNFIFFSAYGFSYVLLNYVFSLHFTISPNYLKNEVNKPCLSQCQIFISVLKILTVLSYFCLLCKVGFISLYVLSCLELTVSCKIFMYA